MQEQAEDPDGVPNETTAKSPLVGEAVSNTGLDHGAGKEELREAAVPPCGSSAWHGQRDTLQALGSVATAAVAGAAVAPVPKGFGADTPPATFASMCLPRPASLCSFRGQADGVVGVGGPLGVSHLAGPGLAKAAARATGGVSMKEQLDDERGSGAGMGWGGTGGALARWRQPGGMFVSREMAEQAAAAAAGETEGRGERLRGRRQAKESSEEEMDYEEEGDEDLIQRTPPGCSPRRQAAEDEVNSLGNSFGRNSVRGGDSPDPFLAWEDVLAGPGDPLEDLGALHVQEELDEVRARVTREVSETEESAAGEGTEGEGRPRACSDSVLAGASGSVMERAWRLGMGGGAEAGGSSDRPSGGVGWEPGCSLGEQGGLEEDRGCRAVSDSAAWALLPQGGGPGDGFGGMGVLSGSKQGSAGRAPHFTGMREARGVLGLGREGGGGVGVLVAMDEGTAVVAASAAAATAAPVNEGGHLLGQAGLYSGGGVGGAAEGGGRDGGMVAGGGRGINGSDVDLTVPTLNMFNSAAALGGLPYGNLVAFSSGGGGGGGGGAASAGMGSIRNAWGSMVGAGGLGVEAGGPANASALPGCGGMVGPEAGGVAGVAGLESAAAALSMGGAGSMFWGGQLAAWPSLMDPQMFQGGGVGLASPGCGLQSEGIASADQAEVHLKDGVTQAGLLVQRTP